MVAELYYYELLGVTDDPSDLELKRAYRFKALLYHPDKNPNDPDARAKFQEISEAYHVLSDPVLRRLYDERGRTAIKDGQRLVDPVFLFAQIFGGQPFEPWVGKLSLIRTIVEQIEIEATQKRLRDKEIESLNSRVPDVHHMIQDGRGNNKATQAGGASYYEDWRESQRRKIHANSVIESRNQMKRFECAKAEDRCQRVEGMIKYLLKRLSALPKGATQDQVAKFQLAMQLERDNLRLQSFGVPMLHTVAEVYRHRAVAFQDYCKWWLLGSAIHYSRSAWGALGDTVTALRAANEATAALKLAPSQHEDDSRGARDIVAEETRPSDQPKSRYSDENELEELVAGKVLNMVYKLTTPSTVCDAVLYDKSCSIDATTHYAETLLMIANIFGELQDDVELGDGNHAFEILVVKASRVKAADL